MPLAPYNPFIGQIIKTNAEGLNIDRAFVAHYTIAAANATAPSATAIKTATTLADGLTTTLTAANINQPAVPRVPSITGNAATAVGNVVFTGFDAAGNPLTETIVSTGAATVNGTRAFASFTSIVLPARGAGGDTISIGLSGAFGLPYTLPHNTVIAILNNTTVTTVASGSYSATVLAQNYITPTAALNGQQIDVYLLV